MISVSLEKLKYNSYNCVLNRHACPCFRCVPTKVGRRGTSSSSSMDGHRLRHILHHFWSFFVSRTRHHRYNSVNRTSRLIREPTRKRTKGIKGLHTQSSIQWKKKKKGFIQTEYTYSHTHVYTYSDYTHTHKHIHTYDTKNTHTHTQRYSNKN